ncbi:MAG: NACHT domain-containing protein [Egibacteraceae bacterium]
MTRPTPDSTNGQFEVAAEQGFRDAHLPRRTPREMIDRILAIAQEDHPDAVPACVVSEPGVGLTMVAVDFLRAQLSDYLQRVSEEARTGHLPTYYPASFDFQKLHQRVRIHTSLASLPLGRIRGRGLGCVYWPEVSEPADESAVVPWATVAQRHRHLVVLGQPGSGKTWLLRSEAHRLAVAAQRQLDDGAALCQIAVPLRVRLDELAGQLTSASGRPGGIVTALPALLASRYQLPPTFTRWLSQHLAYGHCILLLDALDEVSRTDLARLSAALSDFAEHNPEARLVITSRLAGYAGAPLQVPDVAHVELMPFAPTDAETFIDAWLPAPTDAQRVRDQIRANPALQGLSRIPLLLTLLCVLAADPQEQLPSRRNELYERILRRFLAREHRPVDQRPADWEIDRKLELLQHIAQVFADHPDGWTDLMWPDELLEAIRGSGAPYQEFLASGRDPASLLKELSVDDGVLIPASYPTDGRAVPYLFLHRTFHEYLVACHLASLGEQQRWAVIDAHLWFDYDWEQVIALLGGRLERPEWLLKKLLDHDVDLFHMPLLHAGRAAAETAPALATSEIVQVAGRLLQLLTRPWVGTPDELMAIRVLNDLVRVANPATQGGLTALLGSPHADVRRAAATALAGTTQQAALARLTDLLTDRDVRATAARALAGTTDPRVLTRLTDLLSDLDPNVRERAAEALAGTTHEAALRRLTDRLADPDTNVCVAAARALTGTTHEAALSRLTDWLADPDPNVRERAVRAVAGTSNPGVLARVTDLLSDLNPNVRESAVRALAGTNHEGVRARLVDLLSDRRVCAAAARALAGATDEAALARLTDLLADPSPGISMAAARALAGTSNPGVLARLTDLLADPSPRVRERAAEALAGTTDPGALARLTDRLTDPQLNVSAAAAWALAGTTHEAALTRLTDRLADPRYRVRMAAAEALAGTNDPTLAGVLCRYLLRAWSNADERSRLELYGMLAQVAPFVYRSLTAQERPAWLEEIASATRKL